VHQLSQLYDQRQRIQIIVIMLGQVGNFPTLQQVAAARSPETSRSLSVILSVG
jgi:hypothetical protein